MNQFLQTSPFDLYELSLFNLVVKHRSFTKAAAAAGLSQSAITRQIQGIENSLGLELLERTTRSVSLTKAGEFLFQESARLLGDVDQSLRRLTEDFANAKKEIRVGVSHSVSLAHLPGLFHANLRQQPKHKYSVSYQSGADILTAIEANELDLGILCPPTRLPQTVGVTHRFTDAFALIAPVELADQFQTLSKSAVNSWLSKQTWLLFAEETNTGKRLRKWMAASHLKIEPSVQLDNFDLIITLVAIGMGVSFVPIRALALYGRKKRLVRLPMKSRFERQLIVLTRKRRKQPDHLKEFVKNILF
ncbi:MAG TPA: LysR family transcriptional regulator [Candidatus Acidoferrales bacterium]|nr:LysR family transcriptional regulator [Candidatus Acidoferrales bacterium]